LRPLVAPLLAPLPTVAHLAWRLVDALADGGSIEMPLQEMFWGGYFASFVDRFRIRWMLSCASKSCTARQGTLATGAMTLSPHGGLVAP
jgi:hypothetical protein